MIGRYEIAREFTSGFTAALTPAFFDEGASGHWRAGFEAGYRLREHKNEALNAYLVSIGEQPMSIVRLCAISPAPASESEGRREG